LFLQGGRRRITAKIPARGSFGTFVRPLNDGCQSELRPDRTA
jgi:hypothetical protein